MITAASVITGGIANCRNSEGLGTLVWRGKACFSFVGCYTVDLSCCWASPCHQTEFMWMCHEQGRGTLWYQSKKYKSSSGYLLTIRFLVPVTTVQILWIESEIWRCTAEEKVVMSLFQIVCSRWYFIQVFSFYEPGLPTSCAFYKMAKKNVNNENYSVLRSTIAHRDIKWRCHRNSLVSLLYAAKTAYNWFIWFVLFGLNVLFNSLWLYRPETEAYRGDDLVLTSKAWQRIFCILLCS